jgi:hypothetical protein
MLNWLDKCEYHQSGIFKTTVKLIPLKIKITLWKVINRNRYHSKNVNDTVRVGGEFT